MKRQLIFLTIAGGIISINAAPDVVVKACEIATSPLDHGCEDLPSGVSQLVTVLASTSTDGSPVVDEPWTYRDEIRGIEREFQPDQPLRIVLEVPGDEDAS